MAPHPQDVSYDASSKDREAFWSHQAQQLTWHTPPQTVLSTSTRTLKSGISHPTWTWFPDGEISTSYNCLDRHVEAGHGDKPAIFYDSPVSNIKQSLTYSQLLHETETLAGVLREEGVRKGDVVLIYMPMIPAAIIGILATIRLGAIHAVVFGGFSASALAQRIEACTPKLILTASCGIEGAKGPLPYQPMVRGAISEARHKPKKVLIWQRDEHRWDDVRKLEGERNWIRLVKSARNRGLKADNVPVKSSDGLYIIYTSGTTGSPKGVLREAGGHAVGLNFTVRYIFGIRGPGDVLFTASDIGWVVGHSYIIYGPLLAGAATVLFEGKPIGTPSADTFWRICEEYKVNSIFTAPTALRAIRREDPNNKFLTARGERGGLRSLRALCLAGERSEPSIVSLYASLLTKFGAKNSTVIDNWWSSESGSPMTGLSLLPCVGTSFSDTTFHAPLPIKPGSAGKPVPGFDIVVVDDSGEPVPRKSMGNIVLRLPLAPTGLTTLWNDPERFYTSYLKRFDGRYLDTGDAGMIDEDGYVHIMSRSDDIINVAAHRLSTGEIEQAIVSYPGVSEVAVVGIPDTLKGHVPFAFIGFSASSSDITTGTPDEKELLKELNARIRKQIGPIATLGGIIVKQGSIPKTRSGKTLRRVLKEILENGVEGQFGREVTVPATVEDIAVVQKAKEAVKEYFTSGAGKELRAKL